MPSTGWRSVAMTHDELLQFSWNLNREVTRDRDSEMEDESPPSPAVYIDPREVVAARQLEARIAAREGRNGSDERKAEEEQSLINYLRVKYGPSGGCWEAPVSEHERRNSEFRQLSQYTIRNWCF